jgi:hypothetical protein
MVFIKPIDIIASPFYFPENVDRSNPANKRQYFDDIEITSSPRYLIKTGELEFELKETLASFFSEDGSNLQIVQKSAESILLSDPTNFLPDDPEKYFSFGYLQHLKISSYTTSSPLPIMFGSNVVTHTQKVLGELGCVRLNPNIHEHIQSGAPAFVGTFSNFLHETSSSSSLLSDELIGMKVVDGTAYDFSEPIQLFNGGRHLSRLFDMFGALCKENLSLCYTDSPNSKGTKKLIYPDSIVGFYVKSLPPSEYIFVMTKEATKTLQVFEVTTDVLNNILLRIDERRQIVQKQLICTLNKINFAFRLANHQKSFIYNQETRCIDCLDTDHHDVSIPGDTSVRIRFKLSFAMRFYEKNIKRMAPLLPEFKKIWIRPVYKSTDFNRFTGSLNSHTVVPVIKGIEMEYNDDDDDVIIKKNYSTILKRTRTITSSSSSSSSYDVNEEQIEHLDTNSTSGIKKLDDDDN